MHCQNILFFFSYKCKRMRMRMHVWFIPCVTVNVCMYVCCVCSLSLFSVIIIIVFRFSLRKKAKKRARSIIHFICTPHHHKSQMGQVRRSQRSDTPTPKSPALWKASLSSSSSSSRRHGDLPADRTKPRVFLLSQGPSPFPPFGFPLQPHFFFLFSSMGIYHSPLFP